MALELRATTLEDMALRLQDVIGFTIFVAFCVLIFVQVMLLMSNYRSDNFILAELTSEAPPPPLFSTIKIPAAFYDRNILVIFRNFQAYEVSLWDFASSIYDINYVPDIMDFGAGGFNYKSEFYVITSMDPAIKIRKLDKENRALLHIEGFQPLEAAHHFYGETAILGDSILISGGLDEHFGNAISCPNSIN